MRFGPKKEPPRSSGGGPARVRDGATLRGARRSRTPCARRNRTRGSRCPDRAARRPGTSSRGSKPRRCRRRTRLRERRLSGEPAGTGSGTRRRGRSRAVPRRPPGRREPASSPGTSRARCRGGRSPRRKRNRRPRPPPPSGSGARAPRAPRARGPSSHRDRERSRPAGKRRPPRTRDRRAHLSPLRRHPRRRRPRPGAPRLRPRTEPTHGHAPAPASSSGLPAAPPPRLGSTIWGSPVDGPSLSSSGGRGIRVVGGPGPPEGQVVRFSAMRAALPRSSLR